MFKKGVQQGRIERRSEAYASVCFASERCENAAMGKGGPARRGRAGGKSDFFSILLKCDSYPGKRQM